MPSAPASSDSDPTEHVVSYQDADGPRVHVHLSFGAKTVTIWALLDTGAHGSLLPVYVAEQLGIKLRRTGGQRRAAGGRLIRTYRGYEPIAADLFSVSTGTPKLWGPQFDIRPEFAKRVDPPLLGRSDFFHRFIVIFEGATNVVRLREPLAPEGGAPPSNVPSETS